jgi:hypothetical protein
VYLSLSGEGAELEEPMDTNSFKVLVASGVEADASLRSTGWGYVDGPAAMISVAAVRSAAAGRVTNDWVADLAIMLDYARAKQWLSNDGEFIRAHLEFMRSDDSESET